MKHKALLFMGLIVIILILSNLVLYQINKTHYAELRKNCNGDYCCLESVETMETNNYHIANSDDDCPSGYFYNAYKCPTSIGWCEPMKIK